jgi:hypothetical protein
VIDIDAPIERCSNTENPSDDTPRWRRSLKPMLPLIDAPAHDAYRLMLVRIGPILSTAYLSKLLSTFRGGAHASERRYLATPSRHEFSGTDSGRGRATVWRSELATLTVPTLALP